MAIVHYMVSPYLRLSFNRYLSSVKNHSHQHKSSNIGWALLLNISFTVIEIVGGLLTNSIAILSDALHDLGDSISLLLSYAFEKVSQRKANKTFTYGYKRFSLLAAVINSIVLLMGSLYILSVAIPRLIEPAHSNAQGMFLLAVIGILFNGVAVWKLKGGKTMNERTITWHLVEDVLGWVGILMVSIVIYFKDIHILDPILSILFTLYILWGVVKNLKETVFLFLQGAPFDIELLEKELLTLKGVISVHDTHAWSQDGEHHVVSTHLLVDRALTSKEVMTTKCLARELIEKPHVHSTIEIEFDGEECSMEGKCKSP